MDEVGRGTTVKDGLAIAFATVHHLISVNKCRALFATHFHEVTDMLGYSENTEDHKIFGSIGFFCTDVDETDVSQPSLVKTVADALSSRMDILPTRIECDRVSTGTAMG